MEMVRLVVPHSIPSQLFLASATSVYPLLFTNTQQYFYPSGIDWALPHNSHLSDPSGAGAMMAQTHAGLHRHQHRRRRPIYLILGKPIIATAQYQSPLSNLETGDLILPMSQLSSLFSSMKPSTFAVDPVQKIYLAIRKYRAAPRDGSASYFRMSVPLQQRSSLFGPMKSFISVSPEPGCLVLDPLQLYKSHLVTLTCHYGHC